MLITISIVHSKGIVRHAAMAGVANGEDGAGERLNVMVHAQPGRGHEQLIHVWPAPCHRCRPRHWQLVPKYYMPGIWVNVKYLKKVTMLLTLVFVNNDPY